MHNLIFMLIVLAAAALVAGPLWLSRRRQAQGQQATRESTAEPGADPEPPVQI